MTKASKDGVSLIGLGAAACVACCAGPILAFLGGLGIAGLASTLLIGAIGLLITVAAVAAVVVVRRRRSACEVPVDGPVAVAIPTRRAPTTLPPASTRGAVLLVVTAGFFVIGVGQESGALSWMSPRSAISSTKAETVWQRSSSPSVTP